MVLVSDKPSNNIGILQTKFSYGKRHEARRVRPETMPLDQHIESGHRECQARLKIAPAPRQFARARIPRRGMEAGVAQDYHTPINLLHQPLKGVVSSIGGGTGPPHDQPPLIEQQTAFAADNPAMVRQAFAPALLRAAALAHGVD